MQKIEKEKATVEFMIQFYCRHKHKTAKLCSDCEKLTQYAHNKLTKCPYGEKKAACRNCAIHCYEPKMRQEIRAVMQYVGPRMFFYAPISCLKHWLKLK